MITPFPIDAGKSEWKAETRGSTVVSARSIQRYSNSGGQLGIIFSHEMLHLWVPNSLKLEGDYDWFFEGFTLYTALRTTQELGRHRFQGDARYARPCLRRLYFSS